MEDGGKNMELKYKRWKESIFQEKVICECRKRLSAYRRAVFVFMDDRVKNKYIICEICVLYIISIHKRDICLCYEHRFTTLINKN